jgi:anti-sigma factor RsiW
MTCDMSSERLDAWLAGTLNDAEARAVEQHAAECPACGLRLEAGSRPEQLLRELPPPPALRAVTLRAVAQRRAAARWRRFAAGASVIAAIALLLVISRPATKAASSVAGAGTELLARTHARPEFAQLDAAERDVEQALRDHPEDPELTDALTRIRRQREALQRLVIEARS